MIRNKLLGTFRTKGRALVEIQGIIHGNTMNFGFRDALLRVSRGDRYILFKFSIDFPNSK